MRRVPAGEFSGPRRRSALRRQIRCSGGGSSHDIVVGWQPRVEEQPLAQRLSRQLPPGYRSRHPGSPDVSTARGVNRGATSAARRGRAAARNGSSWRDEDGFALACPPCRPCPGHEPDAALEGARAITDLRRCLAGAVAARAALDPVPLELATVIPSTLVTMRRAGGVIGIVTGRTPSSQVGDVSVVP